MYKGFGKKCRICSGKHVSLMQYSLPMAMNQSQLIMVPHYWNRFILQMTLKNQNTLYKSNQSYIQYLLIMNLLQ